MSKRKDVSDTEYDRIIENIQQNPKFLVMVKRKQRFSLLLLLFTLGLYILLILAVGFLPDLIATPLAKGKVTTWGIPAGFFLIIWTLILTVFYINRTNNVYDPLNEALIKEAADEVLE